MSDFRRLLCVGLRLRLEPGHLRRRRLVGHCGQLPIPLPQLLLLGLERAVLPLQAVEVGLEAVAAAPLGGVLGLQELNL